MQGLLLCLFDLFKQMFLFDLQTLDAILIYLRLVHSVDFYNHTDYPHEDEMPNR
jgi:hypothetical protein